MKIIYKKRTILSLLLAASCYLNNGCNDRYFDAQPDNLLNIDNIFSNRAQTENYWGGLYQPIPDIWDQPYSFIFSAITDEVDASNWVNGTLDNINSGALSADNVPTNYVDWYKKIRQCGIFIENVDKCKELLDAEDGPTRVKQYKAEAKFLRAFYYWLFMKWHGPAVLQPLDGSAEDVNWQIPRSSWDECVEFILQEMDGALADLPTEHYLNNTTTLDGTQLGRINKMVVEAVKAEILLFHASPLYNGNTDLSHWKNLDGKQLFNQSYDASRWAKAATQAKVAIDLAEANGKGLFIKTAGTPFESAFLSVRDLFWEGVQKEGVWIRPSTNYGQWERHAAPRAINGTPYNGLAIVQEMVDDFRMNTGEAINESTTYNENTYTTVTNNYYVSGTNNMYIGREPRFYAFVTFNGSTIPGSPKSGMTRVEFYSSGNSGRNGAPRDWPRTGYTARKNLHPTFSMNPSVNVARSAMLIRMAELYLNYAEALNESAPGNPDILKYLNAVRTRGGLPALENGFSQDRIREEIRLERRIELCFEGKRYFDVRRWKVADQDGYRQGGAFHGMDMTKGTSLSSPEFHKRVVAVTRKDWHDKHYFLPWHQMELDRNKQLVQAPGF